MHLRSLLINLQKGLQKDKEQKENSQKKKIKILKTNLQDPRKKKEYILFKNTLDDTYEEKENEIKVRRKCDWYKYRENSTTFLKKTKIKDIRFKVK